MECHSYVSRVQPLGGAPTVGESHEIIIFFQTFLSVLCEKPRKGQKNHEYSRINEKNQIFSAVLDVYFHMNWSLIKYLSTEKNLKILGIGPKDTVSWIHYPTSENAYRCSVDLI